MRARMGKFDEVGGICSGRTGGAGWKTVFLDTCVQASQAILLQILSPEVTLVIL